MTLVELEREQVEQTYSVEPNKNNDVKRENGEIYVERTLNEIEFSLELNENFGDMLRHLRRSFEYIHI